ncbi:MAG TPA: hypothetical protein VHB97_06490 [Polyangia bacterium]|nr:hypothetical protein [Polyangia bacterium]
MVVLFISTPTPPAANPTTMSGLPSPSRSPTAIELGPPLGTLNVAV